MTEPIGLPSQIRGTERPQCPLCGSSGCFIHRDQRDRLFGAYGSWNLKRCSNQNCRLLWLDPMPLAEDLGKAYTNYYTHQVSSSQTGKETPPGTVRRFYRLMKGGYLAGKYGYFQSEPSRASVVAGWLMWLLPGRSRRLDAEVRGLHAVPGGRLLDVGCGSGEWLLWMRSLGWEAEGLDFDERAVSVATGIGLKVSLGSLEQQRFPAESFDALTMSHVIEHLPDPVQTLTECVRVLKPGGALFLWTPNADSLGHSLFGQHWRGLEPPRHLHIFSPLSLQSLLSKAGLVRIRTCTRNSPMILGHSMALLKGGSQEHTRSVGKAIAKTATWALTLIEGAALIVSSQAGELLEAQATKSAHKA